MTSIIAEEGTVDQEVQLTVIDPIIGAKKIMTDLEMARAGTIITLGVTTTDLVTETITETITPEVMPKTEAPTIFTKSNVGVQVETEITTMELLKTMVKEWLA